MRKFFKGFSSLQLKSHFCPRDARGLFNFQFLEKALLLCFRCAWPFWHEKGSTNNCSRFICRVNLSGFTLFGPGQTIITRQVSFPRADVSGGENGAIVRSSDLSSLIKLPGTELRLGPIFFFIAARYFNAVSGTLFRFPHNLFTHQLGEWKRKQIIRQTWVVMIKSWAHRNAQDADGFIRSELLCSDKAVTV